MDRPEMVGILDVEIHSGMHRTFTLDVEVDAKPGQFCMLWIPGVNEKPMSFSNVSGKVAVTVKKVGTFTSHLFMLGRGDSVGFRGPYGRGFEYVAGNVCLVGGGCGVAPLRPLKDKLKGHAIVSARTEDELLFADEFRESGFQVRIATDDGSAGEKSFPDRLLASLLDAERFSCVYACGPEVMMKKVMDLCASEGVPCQLSLERYMKCGIGICGSCSLAGMRVCKEGPVFRGSELKDTEFGVYSRDASGSKRRFEGGC
ncbi:MAG: dihydroorotate dehydrogenase electron transfer subunit [Candidatus Altiarchaeales archaeon]|nr:dihydroorotate dehydrogenase electron transfer subunit [Candidatus Altiarchaeales archaeon]MBD3416273.1 dihydroorotate dehydrogenase electron transfer subunit [Candidatus Altiarchaeales archaeon]